MKNLWMDEIQINNTAEIVSLILSGLYAGKKVDHEAWSKTAIEALFWNTEEQRIRDAVISRYNFDYMTDEENNIIELKLSKLPWLI